MKVAALQLEAFDLSQAQAALDHTLKLLEQAAREHQPDLIVTPECTYPAYVLGSLQEFKANYPGDPLPQFSQFAREHRLHLCVGLATPGEKDGQEVLYNEAVLLGPDGQLIGRTAKSLLWHFDNKWFCAGTEYQVFSTALGKIGMLICADGRQPEIARSLALSGAQLILDPTCWVTYGANVRQLFNPQADFMLATRAWENGVWFVASDKVGLENDSVLYAGRSSIIAPSGEKVAEGPSDREAVVVAEITDLVAQPQPPHFPAPRQPALYSDLTAPTEQLPVHSVLQEAVVPAQAILRCAVAQYAPLPDTQAMADMAQPLLAQLARESVELVVLPDILPHLAQENAWQAETVFPFYSQLSAQSGVAILATASEVVGTQRYKTAALFAQGQELGRWRQNHFANQDEKAVWTSGTEIGHVVKLPGNSRARLGVMLGADGYGPETARILMLRGADLILWPTRANLLGAKGFELAHLARTRAAENRVHLACATPLELNSGLDIYNGLRGSSFIVDSNGAIVAPCLPDKKMCASAQLSVSASREKMRSPGTDVVYSRMPECYGKLVEL